MAGYVIGIAAYVIHKIDFFTKFTKFIMFRWLRSSFLPLLW